jgi:hypothetical protein
MILLQCICQYCGYTWSETFWGTPEPQCAVCNDKNIKTKTVESGDVFGYGD